VDDADEFDTRFTLWLNRTMENRGYSQADLARAVGVADAQVSRWRRGQVVPNVRSLQRLADTFGVPRATLDTLAGYPSGEALEETNDPAELMRRAEIQTYQAWFGQMLASQVPPELWRVYVEGCAALAQSLGGAFSATLTQAQREIEALIEEEAARDDEPPEQPKREIGFRS
jgi:transcriptional regulator with XRE-family HTH domain